MKDHRIKFVVSEHKGDDERGYAKWLDVTEVEVVVTEMQAAAVTSEVLKLLSDASLAE